MGGREAPEMELKKAVGLRIRALRRGKGLTQQKLAERVERSVEAIRAFERGASAPSFETLERLTRALEVPARDFFDFGSDGDDIQVDRLGSMDIVLNAARRLDKDGLELAATMLETLAEQRERGEGPGGG